jgi:Cu(I)/Ag(I) efflux system membrane fusion protein
MHSSKNVVSIVILTLALGLFLGWLWFGGSPGVPAPTAAAEHQHDSTADSSIWTCSMHPQIRMDKPGKCPLCGMSLIPVETGDDDEAEERGIDYVEGRTYEGPGGRLYRYESGEMVAIDAA